MVTNNYVLNLNVDQSDIQETDIKIVQNDYNVNTFEIHIFDGDDEINYSDVDSGIIIFKQAYKDIVKQGDLVKAVDQFTYTLESINFNGDCLCSVQLYGVNDERITTTYFRIKILKDLITDKSVKSVSEYDALKKLKNELEEIDVVDLQHEVNEHLADNVSQGNPHGVDAKANKLQESWIVPTLLNGWSAEIGFSYRKTEFGQLEFKGRIANGTKTPGTILFQLPAGYRPTIITVFPILTTSSSNSITGSITIDPNGDVTITTYFPDSTGNRFIFSGVVLPLD